MRDIYFGSDPDAQSVRSWTRWLAYFLALTSFVAAVWLFQQFGKLLTTYKTGEPVYLYRSEWSIVLIRLIEMAAHLVFFREVVKRAFPNLVRFNRPNVWLYTSTGLIISLPWLEQLWAAYAFPNLVLFSPELRHPFLLLLTMAYGLLPIWRIRLRKFSNYHTGGKIAASLLLLVIIAVLLKVLP